MPIFIWKSKSGGANDARFVAIDHEYSLCYGKNVSHLKFNLDTEAEVSTQYNLEDEKGKYALERLDKQSLGYMESLDFPIIAPDGTEYKVHHKNPNQKVARWRWSKKTVEERYDELVFKDGKVYTKNYQKIGAIARSLLVDERFSRTRTGKTEHTALFGKTLFNNPKPENLMKFIIEITTNPNDIVLDYHVGSGTTCAVAHKMGRRWIGIEQMDYIEDITKVRLQKVLDGEQGGISKAVSWGDGGSFVYFELKKYNQEFVEKILSANTKTELNKVYKEMQENAFLQFWFEKDDFKEVFKDDDDSLIDNLNERKQKLIDILDSNQLYLNYLEINDAKHEVSKHDKILTKAFYGDIYQDQHTAYQDSLDFGEQQ